MQAALPAYRLYTALGRLRYGIPKMPYNAHRIASRRVVSRRLPRVPMGGTTKRSRSRSNIRKSARSSVLSKKRGAAKRASLPNPRFNSGYSMVNMRSKNTAKRRMKHRRVATRDLFTALASRVSMNVNLCNEVETQRGRVGLVSVTDSSIAGTVNHFLPFQIYSMDRTPLSGVIPASNNNMCGTVYYSKTATDGNYGISPTMFIKTVADGEQAQTDEYVAVQPTQVQWSDDPAGIDPATKRKWFLKKTTIDLVMYGQANADTLFRVDVVKMDPRFAAIFNDGIHAGGPSPNPEFNQWALSMIAPYTQNPIYKPRRVGGVMKVVKSYKFKIPEQSADFDRVQSVKTKIVLPMSRIINRFWRKGANSSVLGQPNFNTDPEDAAFMNTGNQDSANAAESDRGFVDPKAAYFLIVRATNTDRRTQAVATPINCAVGQEPTYDIRMRTSYLVDT